MASKECIAKITEKKEKKNKHEGIFSLRRNAKHREQRKKIHIARIEKKWLFYIQQFWKRAIYSHRMLFTFIFVIYIIISIDLVYFEWICDSVCLTWMLFCGHSGCGGPLCVCERVSEQRSCHYFFYGFFVVLYTRGVWTHTISHRHKIPGAENDEYMKKKTNNKQYYLSQCMTILLSHPDESSKTFTFNLHVIFTFPACTRIDYYLLLFVCCIVCVIVYHL